MSTWRFNRFDVGEPAGVDNDSLLLHLGLDCFASVVKIPGHRIPGKGAQESVPLTENAVADEVYCFDEEVAGTHCRIEDLEVEEVVDDAGEIVSDLGRIVGLHSLSR